MAVFSDAVNVLARPIENYVWDVNSMSWVKEQQPILNAGSVTISGSINQGTGGSSAWLVKLSQTSTDNDVDISGITPVSGRLPVDGSGVTQPVSAVSLPLPTGASTLAAQTQPGVDIGDVTINNAAGGSAVNIQDGGNTITVDGSITANAGTNLNTSLLALETTQAAQMSRADTFKTRADTFTTTANGVTVDVSASPMSAFGVQVKATGSVTSWDVRVEGSLNNSEFTTILTHTNVTGDGIVLWTGTLEAPTLYFRSRTAGLILGAGTNVIVTMIGQN